MKTETCITVLLAEDHMVVRQGLKKLLEAERDIEVVGEAANGREAVAMVRKLRPSVIIMDIAMPLLNGVEATRQIREFIPDAKVVILSAHSDEVYVERVMDLGVAGYLIKQTSAHFLSEAIREVQKGNTFFSPSIAKLFQKRNAERFDRKKPSNKNATRLSSREGEVLQLIAEGRANKQIAADLGISVKTIEKHRSHLMQKLDIHDTAGLTRYAISEGIVECDVQLTLV